MTAHLLPVEGLFEHREDGDRAATAVLSRGLGEVTVRPLSEVNLALLPTNPAEENRRFIRSLLAIPLGFLIMAPNGIPVYVLGGPVLGIFAALLLGAFGAVIAFLLMDRPPRQYVQLAKSDGVLVTVTCKQESCKDVVELLRDQHPADLFEPHPR